MASGRCALHKRDREDRRPNIDIRRLYRTARWARMREQKKDEAPFCVDCEAEGKLTVWTELDHQVPHRGDLDIFWDYENLRGRCREHHQAKTARGE